MGVIIDTCIWVNVERGRLAPADVQAVTKKEPVYLSPVTIAELQYGVTKATTPAHAHRRSAAFARIRTKPCLRIDEYTGELLGQITANLDKEGRQSRYRIQDLWIAASAIQYDMSVLTQNVKDFKDIPGLSLLSLPPC